MGASAKEAGVGMMAFIMPFAFGMGALVGRLMGVFY